MPEFDDFIKKQTEKVAQINNLSAAQTERLVEYAFNEYGKGNITGSVLFNKIEAKAKWLKKVSDYKQKR